jgi:hypothetical protein
MDVSKSLCPYASVLFSAAQQAVAAGKTPQHGLAREAVRVRVGGEGRGWGDGGETRNGRHELEGLREVNGSREGIADDGGKHAGDQHPMHHRHLPTRPDVGTHVHKPGIAI